MPLCIFYVVKLCKRPEMNSEPTHFFNKGKVFPSLDDMAFSYQCPETSTDFLRPSKTQFIKNNTSNNRNNISLKLKTKGTNSEV